MPSQPFCGLSELDISDDEDVDRAAFRANYRAFRRGSPAGAVGESPLCLPQRKAIKTGCKLSQSVPNLRSKQADEIRARYDALAILDGVEIIQAPAPPDDGTASPPTLVRKLSGCSGGTNLRTASRLAAVALLTGTLCQVQVELLLRDDANAGNLISLVEYSYCALVSSRALLEPRRLPWACHVQLLLSGVLYSALTNAGLAMRCLPFATALVIKNGNIIANMVVGRLAGRRYSRSQALAAAVISAGLVVST
eukprot:3384342-Prymnesium_polylepis.1